MSQIRAQGWPWSKVKSEQERLQQRPSMTRLLKQIEQGRKEYKAADQTFLEISMALGRGGGGERLAREQQIARERVEAIKARVNALIREYNQQIGMTPQEVYGPPVMTSDSEGESEASPAPDMSGGMTSRRRGAASAFKVQRRPRAMRTTNPRTVSSGRGVQACTMYRDANTGRFVSM